MFEIILFLPVKEMIFYHREIKFYVKVFYLDIHKKTTKYRHKKLLDRKRYTSFQDGGHIRLRWLLFDIILFLTSKREGILTPRDKVPGKSRMS